MTDYNEKERDDYVTKNYSIENDEFDEFSCHISEEHRIEYIEFINRLMDKMRMKSIERMLDSALDEIGLTGGLQT